MVLATMHGNNLDSWHIFGTLESRTYKRADCCPYAGLFSFNYCRVAIFPRKFANFDIGVEPELQKINFFLVQEIYFVIV